MKVIDSIWFTNRDGTIGIIIGEEDITGDRKAYIGPASGTDEKTDTQQILSWGNKFSLSIALRVRHFLTDNKKKKCDFNCGKNGEPLIALSNTDNGDTWLCHLSCLREHLEMQEKKSW